jgi:plastocyanin
MKLSQSILAVSVIAIMGVAAFGLSRQHAFATSISSGDLIRGQTYSAVYYVGADGFRYVFPNQKTYDTWYANFDSVKFISDAELAKIQIGGNATYKPGMRMIKIDSDPKTYAVSNGGVLRHVSSEAVAIALYGATWNKQIDDMPDGFFTNYSIGTAITTASDFNIAEVKAVATSINVDKHLKAAKDISITDSGYSPISLTVNTGDAVRFTNNGSAKHTATSDDLSWGTGTLNSGDAFIRVFKEAGTFTFFDSYDSSNTGAIYVENLP